MVRYGIHFCCKCNKDALRFKVLAKRYSVVAQEVTNIAYKVEADGFVVEPHWDHV